MTTPFENLTPELQQQRIRAWAIAALPAIGFHEYQLTTIQHLVNTTFCLHGNEGQFLVRIHRKADLRQRCIESELRWLEALAEETQLKVQRPRRFPDGQWVIEIEQNDLPRSVWMSVLSWLNGRTLSQSERGLHHYEAIGRMMAQLHSPAQSWAAIGLDRPALDANALMTAENGMYIGWRQLPAQLRRDLESARNLLLDAEQRLGQSRDIFGLIHGDLSFGNVLFAENQAMPIDFDDSGWGYYVYDIAVVLAGAWSQPDFEARREALLNGYRAIRPLSDNLTAELPVFMARRATSLAVWAATQPDDSVRSWVEPQWQRVRTWLEL